MKQKLFVTALLFIALLALCTLSSAATDPIVCTMEVAPSSLSEPGDVTVTITISNSSDTDMTDKLTLFDPTSQVVSDFGNNGSVILKAGEVKTWTGTWSVNQRTLENGQIVFFVKYSIKDEEGNTKSQSQPIRGTITQSNYTAKIAVTCTVTPETAREGQTVRVIYNIVNEGTVSLTNLKLKENKDILADTLKIADELKAGETAKFELPVVMGKKDLTSEGIVTYTIADGTEEQTYALDPQTITYGEPAVLATLSSETKGVLANGTLKLTLKLENTGNVDYTDVRVMDATLGDVFTNQTLPAGKTLTLEKEITLPQSATFMFEVLAIDKTGTEVIFQSNELPLIAVDPDQAMNLTLTLTANKAEVYSTSDIVKFTVTVANDSSVDASNVVLSQAGTEIYTFAAIPAGESRTFTRDVTLGMAGKYQFAASAKDTLDNTMTFESNILQIAFLQATPAPITPDPRITATPEPTFVKATYPKASDPDIATLPKLIRTFFYPLMIISAGLLVIALVILLIATKKRSDLKKASDNAVDHLERSSHRDYVIPADEQTAEPAAPEEDFTVPEAGKPEKEPSDYLSDDDTITEDELPHMKYVRNAYQIAGREPAKPEEKPEEETPAEPAADSAWDTDADFMPKDTDSPYRRRSGRVSPYARKTDEEEQQPSNETGHEDTP